MNRFDAFFGLVEDVAAVFDELHTLGVLFDALFETDFTLFDFFDDFLQCR